MAVAALATAMADLTTRHMAAFPEAARRVQIDTVDLMLTGGDNIVDEAQETADRS